MKKVFLALGLVAFMNPCEAALSAFSQGVREMKEILDSSYLRSHLSQGHPISDLQLFEEGEGYRVYRLESDNGHVFAKLNYIKTARMGPRCYEIEWSFEAK
jgi:hypothetical protein